MAGLKQANNRMALRWCFKQPDKVEPITFFVTCHPTGFTHYAVQGPDVQFVAVEFTQRPPDDLIQILGTLLEASSNAQRRKDERIIVTPETMKKLGLETREAALLLEGASHPLRAARSFLQRRQGRRLGKHRRRSADKSVSLRIRARRAGGRDDTSRGRPPRGGGRRPQGHPRGEHRVRRRTRRCATSS